MNLPRLKHKDLLKEKNLWQIYFASRNITDSKFNWIVGIISLVFFATYATLAPELRVIYTLLIKLSEIGFNTSVTILGFLVAGFTIFGSLTRPNLLLTMLRFKEGRSGLSYLKYNFFTLIRTFICFLIFSAFNLVVIVLGYQDGPGSVFVKMWPDLQLVVGPVVRITFIISAILWTSVFLELKSFVFNIHHFVFTMIKYDAVQHNESLRGQTDESPEDG